jgi:hypothetical protein
MHDSSGGIPGDSTGQFIDLGAGTGQFIDPDELSSPSTDPLVFASPSTDPLVFIDSDEPSPSGTDSFIDLAVPISLPRLHIRPGRTNLDAARRFREGLRSTGLGESDSGVTGGESGTSVPVEQGSDLALGQAAAFVTDTFQTFTQFFVERLADTHGLGVLFRVVKWAYGAWKWVQVAESGGVDVEAPLPLGPDVVLDVSVHLGEDSDIPPITFCVAPSGVSGVGAVALGRLELDPAPSRDDVDWDRIEVPPLYLGPMVVVPLRLSQVVSHQVPRAGSESLEAAQVAAFARQMAEEKLLPELLQRRPMLHDAGIDLVLGYDSAIGLAVWVDLRGTDRPPELWLGLRSGRGDLEITYDPVTGLAIWLGLVDTDQPFSPVVIRRDAANRLEVAAPPDGPQDPTRAIRSPGVTLQLTGTCSSSHNHQMPARLVLNKPALCPYGHSLAPGMPQKVSWFPCMCEPAREAGEQGRGLGHMTVWCGTCSAEDHRDVTFYEPPHQVGHSRPLSGWVTRPVA